MVVGNNKGIQHSFKLTQDAFAESEKELVNHREYYFIAVAYAYNQYKAYNPEDPNALDGQKTPYLRGRKGSSGSIKTISATPHANEQFQGGLEINSTYGDLLDITMVEGMGTGQNFLDLKQSTIDKIMSGAPWKTDVREYKTGHGPIQISIVDPLNIVDDNFILRFDSVKISTNSDMKKNGIIEDAYWYLYPEKFDSQVIDTTIYVMFNDSMAVKYDTTITVPMNYSIPNVVKSYLTLTEAGVDTFKVKDPFTADFRILPKEHFYSRTSIMESNDVVIPRLGICVRINQVGLPGNGFYSASGSKYNGLPQNVKNGYVGSSVEYEDPTMAWMFPVLDGDQEGPLNWIATGNVKEGLYKSNQYGADNGFVDGNNDWKVIADGLFAIYRTLRFDEIESADNYLKYQLAADDSDFDSYQMQDFDKYRRTPSIDIVITKDTNLWSRCPVVEMCELDIKKTIDPSTGDVTSINFVPGPSQGKADKFSLRRANIPVLSFAPLFCTSNSTFTVCVRLLTVGYILVILALNCSPARASSSKLADKPTLRKA